MVISNFRISQKSNIAGVKPVACCWKYKGTMRTASFIIEFIFKSLSEMETSRRRQSAAELGV